MKSCRIAGASLALMLTPASAWGELYVIAGIPTPNENLVGHFALALFRVANDGGVRRTADLVPGDIGTEWIGISYDRHEALIYPKNKSVIVLDLQKATVAKHCELPEIRASLITQFVADVPGRGMTFEQFLSGPPPVGDLMQAMVLDPAVPCDRSLVAVGPTENRFVAAEGGMGIGSIYCDDGVPAYIDEEGNIAGPVFGADDTPWGYRVPRELIADRDVRNIGVIINDARMLVILVKETPGHPSSLLEFRKRDKTWHALPALYGEWVILRSFGKYIAMTETRHKKPAPVRITVTLEDQKQRAAEGFMSPGIEEWRTAVGAKGLTPVEEKFGRTSDYGPDQFESFNDTNDVFPGRLHLFDIDTGKMRTIETKQGDSEILLVEGDTIYYRVADRLYSASIEASGIGAPKQLARDEIIRDSHYAFMTR
jgi:hypothetical protein